MDSRLNLGRGEISADLPEPLKHHRCGVLQLHFSRQIRLSFHDPHSLNGGIG
jgi:hypothetical protein